MQEWQANAGATAVGSMPHTDRTRVLDFLLRQLPEIPVWPQLASFPEEQMMAQYLEGLPGVKREGNRVWIHGEGPEFDRELYEFFSDYLALEEDDSDLEGSRFAFGRESGHTFRQFLQALGSIPPPKAVKGQVTGPFTLLSTLKDQNGRALLYDERFQEALPKHLAMKARWQVRQLQRVQRPVIIFMDEPGLAGYGSSAFISVSEQQVHDLLQEVADGIHRAGALAGIHICANTDWGLVFRSNIDIINFDAYNYLDKFTLYAEPLRTFFDQGGTVAWGLIPTSTEPAALGETADSLFNRWAEHLRQIDLGGMSLQRIARQSLFTPSCGCGTLSEAQAENTIALTRAVSDLAKIRCRPA